MIPVTLFIKVHTSNDYLLTLVQAMICISQLAWDELQISGCLEELAFLFLAEELLITVLYWLVSTVQHNDSVFL